MNASNRIVGSILIPPVFMLLIFICGCTAAEFKQHASDFVKDVTTAAIDDKMNRELDYYDGAIESVSVRSSNASGYLLDIIYSGVENPTGVSIVAEARGPYGAMTEYTSDPVPVSQESGREMIIVHYQGGGGYNMGNDPGPATNIIVKLVRDNMPNRPIASVNYIISQGTVSEIVDPPQQHSPGPIDDYQPYPVDNTPSYTNATPGYCQGYASLAVEQYNNAVQLKCQGIYPPTWGNDYNAHYNWCVNSPIEAASEQKMYRTNVLNDCYANQSNQMKVVTPKPIPMGDSQPKLMIPVPVKPFPQIYQPK